MHVEVSYSSTFKLSMSLIEAKDLGSPLFRCADTVSVISLLQRLKKRLDRSRRWNKERKKERKTQYLIVGFWKQMC
jgi:hypothetical protein